MMPRTSKIIDIFLSSPSDVDEERLFIVNAAREWNSIRGKSTGVFLNVLTWEDAVAPNVSDRSQTVINEQIGDDYDVYLGLMWGKLGSPTGMADSGTVEEFERALERYRGGEAVRLAMLFKTSDIPQSQLDGAQFDKVKEFRRRFSKEGGLYREFSDEDRLRKILARLFEDIVTTNSPEISTVRVDHEDGPSDTSSQNVASRPQETIEGDTEEIGLFEINDKLTEVAARQGEFFESLSKNQNEMNAVVKRAGDEMNATISFGQKNSALIKSSVSTVSQALISFGKFLEEQLPEFKKRNDELIDLTERGLDVSRDFGQDNESAHDLRTVVSEVASIMDTNKGHIDQLVGTIAGIPRLSTEFNKARKGIISQYRELGDEIDRLQAAMKAAVSSYPMESTDH